MERQLGPSTPCGHGAGRPVARVPSNLFVRLCTLVVYGLDAWMDDEQVMEGSDSRGGCWLFLVSTTKVVPKDGKQARRSFTDIYVRGTDFSSYAHNVSTHVKHITCI